MNPITSIAAGSSIGFHRWTAMGADAQFGQYIGFNIGHQRPLINVPPPLLVKSESVVNRDTSLAEEIVPMSSTQILGIVDSEQYTDYISLGKRLAPSSLPGDTIYSNLMFTNPDYTFQTTFSNPAWLSTLFVWSRGALRYRAFFDRAAVNLFSTYTISSPEPESAYTEFGAASTGTDLELPFFSDTPFLRCGGVGVPNGRYKYTIVAGTNVASVGTNLPTTIDFIYYSFGDDYGFSGMYSPPVLFTPAASIFNGVTKRELAKSPMMRDFLAPQPSAKL
jgi:hypothetical protein